jgi:hypothetical protein
VPEDKVVSLDERVRDEQEPFLEQLLKEGARKLLQAAFENEVIEYIQFHKDLRDENGQRLVVRNRHLPERELVSGVGPIPIRQPRAAIESAAIASRENRDYQRATGPVYRASFSTCSGPRT